MLLRRKNRVLDCLRALCAALIATTSAAATDQPIPENRVKAAVVAKLASFVTWPSAALANRKSLDLCVGVPNDLSADLVSLVAGETVDGRTVVVRVVAQAEDVAHCQLLYVPARSAHGPDSLLARARTLPILTIGDYPGFLDDGGIVNLRVVDGHVRFDLDLGAARRAGLQISSQLARLAVSVRGAA